MPSTPENSAGESWDAFRAGTVRGRMKKPKKKTRLRNVETDEPGGEGGGVGPAGADPRELYVTVAKPIRLI